MVQMVDSDKKQLNSLEIVHIALENTKSKYPPDVAYAAILKEMSQPNSMVMQYGNTLFSILKGKNRIGSFKALNADTAQNFVDNGKQFVKWAYEAGLDGLITDFDDPAILQVFKAISRNPPNKDMGYKAMQSPSGKYRVVLQLGKKRGE
jgi:glycerophosphoryl diester phosphodiesterase